MALTKITPQMFDTSAAGHDFNIDNGTFVVDASANRVGIGTPTPSTLLHVNGALTAGTINASGSVVATQGGNLAELSYLGALELVRSASNAFIDFKTTTSEDYDCRIQQDSNGLIFVTGGQGSIATALTLNSSQNAAFAGNATFADNGRAIFGAGSDLQIYHDGGASYVQDTGTGALYLQGDGGVNIRNAAGTENKAVFASDGAVTLYYNNAAKFATTSTGISVTGTVNATSDFKVNGTLFIDSAMNAQNLNVVQVATGSATAPSFRFTGDTDTGISRSAANTLNLITGGVTRVTLDSVGNLTSSGNIFATGTVIATDGASITNQTNMQLALRDSANTNMRANFMVEKAANSNRGGLAIQATEVGVANDRDLYLQPNGGRVGILNTSPTEAFEVYGSINTRYQSYNFATGAQRGFIDMINASKIVRVGSTSGAATASGDQGAVDMVVNATTRARFDVNGNVAVSSHGNAPNNTQKTNTSITPSQSLAGTWSATSGDTGTYVARGNIEVAGIYNRHVMKFGFSGNLAAQTYYPFVKRSELTSAIDQTGSGSEDGFAMYFRLYTYLSSVGVAEYGSNRLSNMIWINNFGSNSVQTHYFNFGPGFGHAPNTGDSGYGETGQFRLRVQHRMGNDSTFPSNQTFEIFSNSALTGLNPAVSGRQFLIYGYIL